MTGSPKASSGNICELASLSRRAFDLNRLTAGSAERNPELLSADAGISAPTGASRLLGRRAATHLEPTRSLERYPMPVGADGTIRCPGGDSRLYGLRADDQVERLTSLVVQIGAMDLRVSENQGCSFGLREYC